MSQKMRKERITKDEWYARGGFANPTLFRQQSRGGAWRYYVNLDREMPVANRCPGCGITVLRSSDNPDGVCSTCKGPGYCRRILVP